MAASQSRAWHWLGEQPQQIGGGFLADLVSLVVRDGGGDLLRAASGQRAMGGGCGGQDVRLVIGDGVGEDARTGRMELGRAFEGTEIALEKITAALPLVVGDSQLVVVDQKRRDPNRRSSSIVEIRHSHHA